jgi:hypothetical protein
VVQKIVWIARGICMKRFQRGEEVYVRLAFHNRVPITNILVIFAHEKDQNEQLEGWFWARDENRPISPALQTTIDFSMPIEKDKKLGVYALDTIRFETFSGNTLDYQGDIETPKFEVIESDVAPIVRELSIFTKSEWERLKRHEQD